MEKDVLVQQKELPVPEKEESSRNNFPEVENDFKAGLPKLKKYDDQWFEDRDKTQAEADREYELQQKE